jgi:hypothetical protein
MTKYSTLLNTTQNEIYYFINALTGNARIDAPYTNKKVVDSLSSEEYEQLKTLVDILYRFSDYEFDSINEESTTFDIIEIYKGI